MKKVKKSFNSTLVQLKVDGLAEIDITKPSFNSTLVQLKDQAILASVISFYCFNSTLVQLKESIFSINRKTGTKFQFYLSSIKRKYAKQQKRNIKKVSILP